jgi:hypothetical protein
MYALPYWEGAIFISCQYSRLSDTTWLGAEADSHIAYYAENAAIAQLFNQCKADVALIQPRITQHPFRYIKEVPPCPDAL